MDVVKLLAALHREVSRRAYITLLDVMDQSATVLKARLHISSDLFVQVYRNDRFDTTSLVLIYNGRRIYGRDQLGGVWHRHPAKDPHLHDTSSVGRQPVGLAEFLDEIEAVLAAMDLP
jgi:hypothetical protein